MSTTTMMGQSPSRSHRHPVLTRELPKDSPELSDVSGEGDVGVQDDDFGEVGGQRLGKCQLHQPIDAGVVLVGDPRHLWLQGDTVSGRGMAMSFLARAQWLCSRADEASRGAEPLSNQQGCGTSRKRVKYPPPPSRSCCSPGTLQVPGWERKGGECGGDQVPAFSSSAL